MFHIGDHVALYPVNDQDMVNRLGELLDVDLDTVITLVNVDGEYFIKKLLDNIAYQFIDLVVSLIVVVN